MDSVGADSHADGSASEHRVDTGHPDDSDSDLDHCENCCHGHIPALTPHYAGLKFIASHNCYHPASFRVVHFSQAPPTPPPTV